MSMLAAFTTAPALLIFLVLVTLYVLRYNFTLACNEPFRVEPLAGEVALDHIEIRDSMRSDRALVSDRRITTLAVRWPLSRRRHLSVAWMDVLSIRWWYHMNWLLLLAGVIAMPWLTPATLVLVMLGLESRVGILVFETPYTLMPWSRPTLVAWRRFQIVELDAFHRRIRAIWARNRTSPTLKVSDLPPVSAGAALLDLAWGRTVWISVAAYLFMAAVQRATADHHLSLDSTVFLPLFVGLVTAAGTISRRDGVWTALLGTAALFTVKFPNIGLGDGVPWYGQFLLLGVVFVVMAVVSDAVTRQGNPLNATLVPLLWLVFVGAMARTELLDITLYARVFFAMAATIAWRYLLSLEFNFATPPRRTA